MRDYAKPLHGTNNVEVILLLKNHHQQWTNQPNKLLSVSAVLYFIRVQHLFQVKFLFLVSGNPSHINFWLIVRLDYFLQAPCTYPLTFNTHNNLTDWLQFGSKHARIHTLPWRALMKNKLTSNVYTKFVRKRPPLPYACVNQYILSLIFNWVTCRS